MLKNQLSISQKTNNIIEMRATYQQAMYVHIEMDLRTSLVAAVLPPAFLLDGQKKTFLIFKMDSKMSIHPHYFSSSLATLSIHAQPKHVHAKKQKMAAKLHDLNKPKLKQSNVIHQIIGFVLFATMLLSVLSFIILGLPLLLMFLIVILSACIFWFFNFSYTLLHFRIGRSSNIPLVLNIGDMTTNCQHLRVVCISDTFGTHHMLQNIPFGIFHNISTN